VCVFPRLTCYPARRCQAASPTRALPSFSLSNSLLRALFQARPLCLAFALSLPRTPGVRFPRGPGSLLLACVFALMLSLSSMRARPVSLFSSLAPSLSCSRNFSLSLSLPLPPSLFLPPVLSLAFLKLPLATLAHISSCLRYGGLCYQCKTIQS